MLFYIIVSAIILETTVTVCSRSGNDELRHPRESDDGHDHHHRPDGPDRISNQNSSDGDTDAEDAQPARDPDLEVRYEQRFQAKAIELARANQANEQLSTRLESARHRVGRLEKHTRGQHMRLGFFTKWYPRLLAAYRRQVHESETVEERVNALQEWSRLAHDRIELMVKMSDMMGMSSSVSSLGSSATSASTTSAASPSGWAPANPSSSSAVAVVPRFLYSHSKALVAKHKDTIGEMEGQVVELKRQLEKTTADFIDATRQLGREKRMRMQETQMRVAAEAAAVNSWLDDEGLNHSEAPVPRARSQKMVHHLQGEVLGPVDDDVSGGGSSNDRYLLSGEYDDDASPFNSGDEDEARGRGEHARRGEDSQSSEDEYDDDRLDSTDDGQAGLGLSKEATSLADELAQELGDRDFFRSSWDE
ncbi:hypothetical protein GMORB2_0665 [Geosmithia morbida]|uniref:Uncharacterized protein n=1 Tax=Geosmithia morbida TaxID=1094350 RepID=A0A9P4Z465_9HYPO|nr:uncharacterized protein GMORB2_0665 [Geosmithia morbida]KAF4126928.1 hypothetical protein GMORB2_0665 [Geosmithia morbida]